MGNKYLIKVFAAMILGAAAGYAAGTSHTLFGVPWFGIFDLLGQLFLNALTLVVVPLVASSIITGTTRIGKEEAFAQLGRRTLSFFLLTSLLAVGVAVLFSLLVSPGITADSTAMRAMASATQVPELAQEAAGGIFEKVRQILFRLVPSNVIAVASQGQMLGLILFCVLFGFYSCFLEPSLSRTIADFWNGTFQIMMRITHLVMRALPVGVFALMAKVAAMTGWEAIKPVAFFFGTVILGLGLYAFILLPLLLKVIGGINPLQHFRFVTPALLTAFTTSSSAATLPITLECMEKRAGIPNRICSFALPLGSTVNLTGTAIYATIAVLFIAQVYGMKMDTASIAIIALLGLFTSLGMVAGIPSASLITIVLMLQTLGLPADGIIYILAVERILDMFRTTVNVFGNTCCCALVHKTMSLELKTPASGTS